MMDFTLRHGRIEGPKRVLDRKSKRLLLRIHALAAFGLRAHQLIESLMEELRLARQILDTGGITIVESGDTIVTAYNVGGGDG